MKRLPLILVIIFATIIVAFYFWSAMVARKKQQDLLSKFNEVNKELNARMDSMNAKQRIADAQKSLPVGMMNSNIVLLIDSLKGQFELPENAPHKVSRAKLERDVMRLLDYIREVNKYKWMAVDSIIPDTISYWPVSTPYSKEKWLSLFFGQKEATITYLNYLRQQAIGNID